MPGYLDQYGTADARREKIIRTVVISLVSVSILAGVLTFVFYNYREESQTKRFFALLEEKNYKDAYAMFQPGPGYPMKSFLRDWGPDNGSVENFHIVKSRSCGSGVLLTVRYGRDREQVLWVERQSLAIGFAPFPACPANGHPPVSVPVSVQ
ncbi:MAG TPA: hypothetical protein VML19_23985 [Verrucomicrobiae bacterium]|nr:hypothetical protein [Verrucomicrobiae bacterium]